jgi:phage portal protein BeeE
MNIKHRLQNFALKALGIGNRIDKTLFFGAFGGFFSWLGWKGITYYNNKIVYAGLNMLVKKLTEPEILINKVRPSKQNKISKYYSRSISNEQRAFVKAQTFDELDSHELLDLLERPNPYQTGIELREQFWFNYQYGDGFIIAINDNPDSPGAESRRFKPNMLLAINRNRVDVVRSEERFRPIAYYRITLFNGEQIVLFPDQVFHLQKWNPETPLWGAGFTYSSAATIEENYQNTIARGAAYRNGGRGTLFSSDTGGNSDDTKFSKMTADQMSSLKSTVENDMAGAENNRRMFFTNGFVSVQNYGDTLAEMEMIDADKSNWKDIYAVLGIPVSLTPTGDGLTDKNQEAGYKGLVTNTIIPDLRKFDLKFKQFVSIWYPDIIPVHDLTAFSELMPDYKLLSEIYGKPKLTVDENRALFQYDNLDDADQGKTILVDGNQKTIEQIIDGTFVEPMPEQKQYDYLR